MTGDHDVLMRASEGWSDPCV